MDVVAWRRVTSDQVPTSLNEKVSKEKEGIRQCLFLYAIQSCYSAWSWRLGGGGSTLLEQQQRALTKPGSGVLIPVVISPAAAPSFFAAFQKGARFTACYLMPYWHHPSSGLPAKHPCHAAAFDYIALR